MSKNTKNKYYNFMLELYNQKEFDIKQMQMEHRISTRLCTLMRERGMIKREGKITRWIGDMPTQAIASAIAKECLKQSRIANSQSKAGTHQMVIKPIKRIERVATMPVRVQEEPIHDTSNSKMFLLMAVGTAIGFLIATIIWK